MMRFSLRLRGTVGLVLFASTIACASHRTAENAPRIDRSVLTQKDMEGTHFETAYDAVEALRTNWLNDRGPMTFSKDNPVIVLVYLDNVKLGGVETLRTIPIGVVSAMHHLNGVDAQARYGIGHGAGVIVVESLNMGQRPKEPEDLGAAVAVIENPPGNAPGGFPLSVNHLSAPIVASASDFPGVLRAARDLKADVGRVTSAEPAMILDTLPHAHQIVLVGTLGKSPRIDKLVQSGKLDVTGVAGKWESYLRQVVTNPEPGVDEALVIAGSDKRGTIYGIYDLSSQIGVSPWYWWADVPPRHQAELLVPPARFTQGEPVVKYRGIFINDEAPAFSGWAREKFGGVNHAMYEKMFELILRMKGNYLWPAMWGNAFADDDSLNAKLADEYGIVMGTSHHEPMTRAQQEWKRYGKGEWNYEHNDSTLRDFWRKGIERMGTRENIVTLGMRGDGDMPMAPGSNIALLERIVADQRKILADVTGMDPSKTPTLWALYKEVQDYYDKGMRTPDDVTLLFSDDNWGNIRRLPEACRPEHSPLSSRAAGEGPTLCKSARSGGFGVYYHFDYVGGPRNYKWINTNPIARVWEQMHLANEYGANRIWIVNVGDLKPMEFPIQFFLDYAWDPSKWPAERLPEYTRLWARQQFGTAHAAEIADVMTKYLKYAGRRKPELLAPETYSLANYREAETVVADYAALLAQAERLSQAMPAESKDAFYELVLHPVQAAANLNELYVAAAKNRLYAQQGRASANDQADLVRKHFDRDPEISRYYNTQLAGGKWSHMMDQTHIGYTYWQEPPRNVMPRVDVIQVPAGVEMGVAYEGQPFGPPVFTPGQPRGPREAAFPDFDPYARQSYFIDIYSKRTTPFDYTVEAGQPWVQISAPKGRVDKEQRVFVSVDWSRAPVGTAKVPVTVTGPDGAKFVVQANVKNPAAPRREDISGFVESNGYVSMEAEHYSRAVATAPIQWIRIPDLGRTLSGVTPTPVVSSSQTPSASSPRLEYQLFTFDSGAVSVHAYLSPTLNFSGSPTGLRYAVSFDDEAPQIVNTTADSSQTAWNQMVSDNIAIMTTKHQLASPGAHVLKFWMVDPGIVLQKLVVDAGGVKPSYLGPPESFRPTKGASRQAQTTSNAADPRFDWFEYRGNDAAFNAVAAGPDDYRNPILAGFYPDPSMVRVGDDYYVVTSSFAYFPGIPIFHSKDLVNWTQIGNVLDRRSQLNLDSAGISRGLFAPAIRYNAGTFYMIVTLVDRGGNFFVTATNPAGPWSEPTWLPSVDGIDPSFFFDDNGKAYVVNNGPPIETPRYSGHRAIWIQEFDAAAKKMVGPRTMIVNGGTELSKNPIWIEAPHIFKRNGFYYLICAEGGTAYQHSEVVFRGSAPTGPWTPYSGNPILTQRHLDRARPFPITTTGHADFVDTPNGEWWAVFLGVRPYGDDLFNTGRETFLMPVRWVDDWPVITSGNELVPYVHRRPALPKQPAPAIPTSGNFTVRDEFDTPTLPLHWMTIRGPGTQWYDLTSSPGSLTLRSRSATFQPSDQPSFVGRRQQHAEFSASTAMTYAPSVDGDKAGMVAFQNDQFYYFLAVAHVNGQTVVQLEKHAGPGAGTIVASAPLSDAAPVYLKIQGHGALYDFSYATRPGEWTLLQRDADGTILSTKVAQGFVGAMIGLYAYSPSH